MVGIIELASSRCKQCLPGTGDNGFLSDKGFDRFASDNRMLTYSARQSVAGLLDEAVARCAKTVSVVVIGRQKSGKTSMIHALCGFRAVGRHCDTPGVEYTSTVVDSPEEGAVQLQLWEAGAVVHEKKLANPANDGPFAWASPFQGRRHPFTAAVVMLAAELRQGFLEAEEVVNRLLRDGVTADRIVVVVNEATGNASGTDISSLSKVLKCPVLKLNPANGGPPVDAVAMLLIRGKEAASEALETFRSAR
ncbi:hypothetical protein DIPPA_34721 [Diplonema papillatum]|nr:hypothetical protein DIPPA_34721 [Diplonema papillatum]|eukprot:gene11110-17079_t